MSNKVITVNTSQTSSYFGDVFIDINMQSSYHALNLSTLQSDKDFMAFLGIENSQHLSAISTEKSHNELIRIYYNEYLNSKNNKENQTLSGYNIQKLTNEDAIKNSLHNIFTWIKGERILQPEFGSKLRTLLYEGITDYNQEQIIAEINSCITEWEPRVKINTIQKQTTNDDIENNTVHLKIIYSIPELSKSKTYTLNYTTTIE